MPSRGWYALLLALVAAQAVPTRSDAHDVPPDEAPWRAVPQHAATGRRLAQTQGVTLSAVPATVSPNQPLYVSATVTNSSTVLLLSLPWQGWAVSAGVPVQLNLAASPVRSRAKCWRQAR